MKTIVAFEIISVPVNDRIARGYDRDRKAGFITGLLPRNGTIASRLIEKLPVSCWFDDCSSIGVMPRHAAALRRLLAKRGWVVREYRARYMSSNHGQWFVEVS